MMDSVPCPHCGNENTQPMIYGYASAEEIELFEAGIWWYAGPIPAGELPSHRCPDCKYFWTVSETLPTKRPLIRKCHFCDAALTEYDRQTFEHVVADYYQFWRENDHHRSIPVEFELHPFPICQACQVGIDENEAELALDRQDAQILNVLTPNDIDLQSFLPIVAYVVHSVIAVKQHPTATS